MTVRTLPLLAVSAVAAVAFLVLTPAPAQSFSGGAPPNFAGNINLGDGTPRTCAVSGCHATFALNSGSGGVSIAAPSMAAPGQAVRITVTVDNQTDAAPGTVVRQGFEATVRDPLNPSADVPGTLVLVDPANTQFAQGNPGFVTHTAGGTAQTSWTFDWTPDASVGTARVYVAGNAANGGQGSNGDHIYTATADITIGSTALRPDLEVAFEAKTPRPHPARAGSPSRMDIVLDRPGTLVVRLVDGLGRTVRDVVREERAAGETTVALPTDVPPGTYFAVIEGPGGQRTQPFVVVR